jgi:type II pantothenate kinase
MSNPIRGAATVGVDVGASLCKLVLPRETEFVATKFPSSDMHSVRACLGEWGPERVIATGGGAARLEGELSGVRVHTVPEFAALARGAPLLAAREGLDLPQHYLLVSLGTGTSVLSLDRGHTTRVGGSALGGGTLLGLGRLLLGVETFDEICALASHGDRRRVDLLVGDIYPGGEIPLPLDLNASSFAKLDSREPADIAHALMGMLGENIALICGTLARSHRAQAVVYCGSTLIHNPELREILRWVTKAYGAQPHFLDSGAYCGAYGAAALADEIPAHPA